MPHSLPIKQLCGDGIIRMLHQSARCKTGLNESYNLRGPQQSGLLMVGLQDAEMTVEMKAAAEGHPA